MSATQATVIQAVHSIWEEWFQSLQSFGSERPEMHTTVKEALEQRLPFGWSVTTECRPLLPRRYSAWSRYDIGVLQGSQLIALLELSLGDTNVGHALHNGELKLLGNGDGIGISTGRSFSKERGLTPTDIATVGTELSKIPVRGLFFVNPGPREVLDRPEKAMWWETKAKDFKGETRFWSALVPPDTQVTLHEVFARLADAGLCCWFYSLCGEKRLEFLGNN